MKTKSDFYQSAQINLGTLPNQVKNHIQNAIIRGELKPGEMIVESLVAEKLGISRAPIREAMRILEAKGLVNIIPRKGIFVSVLSIDELTEMYEVRVNLELLALKNAFINNRDKTLKELEQSIDKQKVLIKHEDIDSYMDENINFHEIFIMNSNNSYLISLLHNIEDLTLRYRASSMVLTGRFEKSFNDHLSIFNYLASNELSKALNTLENHIYSSAVSLKEALQGKEENR